MRDIVNLSDLPIPFMAPPPDGIVRAVPYEMPRQSVVYQHDTIRIIEAAWTSDAPFEIEALDEAGIYRLAADLTPMQLLQLGNECIAAALNFLKVGG